MKFGRWTVIYRNGKKWHCVCECGNERDVLGCNLQSGATKSCGCYHSDTVREQHTSHGLAGSPIYAVWAGMKARCYYENHIDHKWYKESGITVCDEWRYDFSAFYNWMMDNGYEKGLSVDRIDNTKGYCPENCRLSTAKEQANNRTSNLMYTYDGKTQSLKSWADEYGIRYTTLYYRVKHGWDFERAITTN